MSPLIRAFAKKYRKLNLLQLDAHPDLYDQLEGNRYSHACPFARIMEEELVFRLLQIGIRTMDPPQREQAKRFEVEVIEMREWHPEIPLEFEGNVALRNSVAGCGENIRITKQLAEGIFELQLLSQEREFHAFHPLMQRRLSPYGGKCTGEVNDMDERDCPELIPLLVDRVKPIQTCFTKLNSFLFCIGYHLS